MAVRDCLRLRGVILLMVFVRLLQKAFSELSRAIGFYSRLLRDTLLARIFLSLSLHDGYGACEVDSSTLETPLWGRSNGTWGMTSGLTRALVVLRVPRASLQFPNSS